MVIGHGWDPSLNLQRRQVIDADTTEETMTGTGQVIRFELSVKESVDEVLNTLDLSADASYFSAGFSAGISAEYLKSQKTSRLYTYVLATVKVQNPPRNLTNIALLAQTHSDALNMPPDDFYRTYGTHVLTGIVSGGFFAGVIEIETSSAERREALKAAANFSGWGGEADVSIAQQINEITRDIAKTVRIFQSGGDGVMETSIDGMINKAVNFPLGVREHVVPIQAIVTEVHALISLPRPPDDLEVMKRAADYRTMGQSLLKAREIQDDLIIAMEKYDQVTALGEEVLVYQSSKPSFSAYKESFEDTRLYISSLTDNAARCKNGEVYQLPAPINVSVKLPTSVRSPMPIIAPGTIVMWSGSEEHIPRGWAICDGTTEGVPDLRERFILCAGLNVSAGSTHEGDVHRHAVDPPRQSFYTTAEGSHTHQLPSNWYARRFDDGKYQGIDTNAGGYNKNKSISSVGDHRHLVEIDLGAFKTGPAAPLKPRYFALVFIMKLSWSESV